MPIVDNIVVPDQILFAVRDGKIRPHTPISWNYSKDDSWVFSAASYNYLRDFMVPAMSNTIKEAQSSMGFKAPPPYQNELFKLGFEAVGFAEEINALYGCQDNENDCIDQFAELTQDLAWVCNSRWAFNGAIKNNPEKWPLYPMEWGRPNCEKGDDGKNTKSCHCGETSWVRGNGPKWSGDLAEKMKNTYGQFYINGTFDKEHIKKMSLIILL